MSTSSSIKTQDTPTDIVPREELLDPLQLLLDAARFIEHDKPGWAKSARAAVARARDPAQAATKPVAWRWRWKDVWENNPWRLVQDASGISHITAETQPLYAASTLPSTDRAGK